LIIKGLYFVLIKKNKKITIKKIIQMKCKIVLMLFLCINQIGFSQVFPVDTVVYNGLPSKRIKFVFLSDGYTNAQLPDFVKRVTDFKNNLFTQPPFSNYKNFFNFYAIKVPSVESGVDHPGTATDVAENLTTHPALVANTYFNSTFDYAGIHRLVFPQNGVAINNVLFNNFPTYNQIFVFANSTFYGGSGGIYATSTVNVSSDEISIHEIGHSFANLADEYAIGGQGEKANRTAKTDSASVRWKNWLGGNNIGIFPIGIEGWQRPHQNCKMQFLNVPFCAVCRESFVERIYSIVTPINSFLPTRDTIKMDSTRQFSVNLTLPTPNTLKTEWKLNNNTIANNIDSVKIQPSALINGDNKLTIFVTDTTTLSRQYLPKSGYVFSKTWTLNKTSTAIHTSEKSDKFYFQIAPNPVQDVVQIKGNSDYNTDIRIEMYNEMGEKVYHYLLKNANNAFEHSFPIAQLPNGIYVVVLNLPNGFSIKEKILKME
jgi:hypothetical protein